LIYGTGREKVNLNVWFTAILKENEGIQYRSAQPER
jgi:hypothetical protein